MIKLFNESFRLNLGIGGLIQVTIPILIDLFAITFSNGYKKYYFIQNYILYLFYKKNLKLIKFLSFVTFWIELKKQKIFIKNKQNVINPGTVG